MLTAILFTTLHLNIRFQHTSTQFVIGYSYVIRKQSTHYMRGVRSFVVIFVTLAKY